MRKWWLLHRHGIQEKAAFWVIAAAVPMLAATSFAVAGAIAAPLASLGLLPLLGMPLTWANMAAAAGSAALVAGCSGAVGGCAGLLSESMKSRALRGSISPVQARDWHREGVARDFNNFRVVHSGHRLHRLATAWARKTGLFPEGHEDRMELLDIEIPTHYAAAQKFDHFLSLTFSRAIVDDVETDICPRLSEREVDALAGHEVTHAAREGNRRMSLSERFRALAVICVGSPTSLRGRFVSKVLGYLEAYRQRMEEFSADEGALKGTRDPQACIDMLAKIVFSKLAEDFSSRPEQGAGEARATMSRWERLKTRWIMRIRFMDWDLLRSHPYPRDRFWNMLRVGKALFPEIDPQIPEWTLNGDMLQVRGKGYEKTVYLKRSFNESASGSVQPQPEQAAPDPATMDKPTASL